MATQTYPNSSADEMKRLLLLLFVLFFTDSCTFANKNMQVSLTFAPTLTSAEQVETSPVFITPPSSPTLSTQNNIHVNLFCETYIETTWGDGPEQWGFPEGFEYRPAVMLPPEFDNEGRLYVTDYINQRILRYDTQNSPPIEISLRPLARLAGSFFPFFSFSIAIDRDRILVPYSGNYGAHIGILSKETGDIIGSVEVPDCHYDPYFPTYIVIGVDNKGRLYFLGQLRDYPGSKHSHIESVFFEPGWKDGKWQKVELPEDMRLLINPYFWGDYVVSEIIATNTMVIELSNLDARTRVSIDTGLEKRWPLTSLCGVDESGNVCLSVGEMPPSRIYAKYNLLSHQIQVALMQLDTGYSIVKPRLSPDGHLYILIYSEDMSVHPRIVKCSFP